MRRRSTLQITLIATPPARRGDILTQAVISRATFFRRGSSGG